MPASKKALLRYQILNGLLQNTNGYSIKELTEKVNWEMEKLESPEKSSYMVSDRMIRIDLENMMDVYPIQILKKGNKYYYENAEESIDNINIREEDKTALNLALGVFSRFNGTPIYDKFSDVITRVIASSVLRKLNTTDTKKYIQVGESTLKTGIEWLETVYNAIVDKKAINLHYKNFGETTSIRTVSPYMLKEYRNQWYMIAYVHELNKPDKTLLHRLSRIVEVEPTEENYIEDATFDGNKYFKYSLGVFHKHAEEPIDVKLRIRGKGIIKLLLEDKIHPTQESIPINDQEMFLSIRIYNTPELENMILGWGEHIEVMEPLSLRVQMSKRISEMLKLYS